jgi:beta-galactosidase
MHGSLVDQSGRPRPFYEEARQIGQDFSSASTLLAGTTVKASVAMLNDYDSLWALQWQPHHRDFDYIEHFTHYYRPLAALNVAVDVVSAQGLGKGQSLTEYKLMIAPALLLQNERMVAALQKYVSQGGHLVLTLRSGMKDEYNTLLPLRQPGKLAEIAGIEVEEYYALLDPVPVAGKLFTGESQMWAERLIPIGDEKARTIARYGKSNGWLDEQIAISVHSYEKGLVYYVGAYLDETSQKALLARMLKTAAVTTVTAPPGIEISTRVRPGGEIVYIVINHTNAENTIHMPWPVLNHLTGEKTQSELNFAPYGVAVVTQLKGEA